MQRCRGYNLKRLHRLVAGNMPKPRTLFGAWREMRETLRQQADPAYEFDTPVPSPAGTEAKDPDPIAGSMGGLTPPALTR